MGKDKLEYVLCFSPEEAIALNTRLYWELKRLQDNKIDSDVYFPLVCLKSPVFDKVFGVPVYALDVDRMLSEEESTTYSADKNERIKIHTEEEVPCGATLLVSKEVDDVRRD